MILPGNLWSKRANGEFFRLEVPFTTISDPQGFVVGVLDNDGFFRGIYTPRVFQLVKIKRRAAYDYLIGPLSPEEIARYPIDQDFTRYNDEARNIMERRRRGH